MSAAPVGADPPLVERRLDAKLLRVSAITLPHRARGSLSTSAAAVAAAVSAVRGVAAHRPDLICLPENALYDGLADRRPSQVAVPACHDLIERFSDLARECGALLAVPFLEAADDAVYNAVILLDPTGERPGIYRKQLLWPSNDPMGALEGGLSPGDGAGAFPTRFGTVGVRICLEVQYPSLWQDLATSRAKLVLFPSEQAGGAILCARAWQTRSYILSAVSKGGPSALINPVGQPVAQWGPGSVAPVFEIGLDYEVVHLDPAEDTLRWLARRLRGRVAFEFREAERVCLVTSTDPTIATATLLSDADIPTLDAYLDGVRAQNRASAEARVARRTSSLGESRTVGPARPLDQSPRVSVVVPSRGDSPGLRRTLGALARQQLNGSPAEIVVVLNGAQTDLPAPPEGVLVVHEPTRGPAAARNTGIRVSSGEVIALVDDDCEPSPQWLQSALDALRRAGPGAVVAGAITRSGAEQNLVSRFDSVSYLRQQDYVRYSKAFVTANVTMYRSVFDRVGGFDESFPEAAGEDWDWARRAGRLGVPIVYAEKAAIDHPCLTDSTALRAKAERLGRGEARLRQKYAPHAAPVGLLAEVGRQLRRSRGHTKLPLGERLRLEGLSVMVGYWMWQGRRGGVGAGGKRDS